MKEWRGWGGAEEGGHTAKPPPPVQSTESFFAKLFQGVKNRSLGVFAISW